jgi:ABC-2 type transport system ATP-binding protein
MSHPLDQTTVPIIDPIIAPIIAPIIEMRGVRKTYPKVNALNGVDLDVAEGSVLALLGPNGAGKSTLVRILATLLQPDAGQITIAGCDLRQEPEAVRRAIALTGQATAVDELLTGNENMHMAGRLFHLDGAATRRRAAQLLEQFDLASAANRLVKTYSGGMRRRLDLAMSLMVVPRILFLDEPTTGLDPRSRLAMWATIRDLLSSGLTIFLTTQYLEEADQLADKIAVMDGGRIIAEGSAAELKRRVGREHLEFIFANSHELNLAQDVFGKQVVAMDEQKNSLRLAIGGSPKELKLALDDLEQARIEAKALALHKPTLDDVFLIMTGHTASGELGGKEGGYNG